MKWNYFRVQYICFFPNLQLLKKMMKSLKVMYVKTNYKRTKEYIKLQ